MNHSTTVPEGISSPKYSLNLCFQCTPNTAWYPYIPNIVKKKEQLLGAFLTWLLSCPCKVSGLKHTEHHPWYMPHSAGEPVPALVRAGSLPKGQYMRWSSCYPHGLLHPSNQMFPITLCTLATGHYAYFMYLALVSFFAEMQFWVTDFVCHAPTAWHVCLCCDCVWPVRSVTSKNPLYFDWQGKRDFFFPAVNGKQLI